MASDELDLDAYLERTGYRGPFEPRQDDRRRDPPALAVAAAGRGNDPRPGPRRVPPRPPDRWHARQ